MADRHPLKRQGDVAFKEKQYTAAIDAYTRLLEEDPTQVVCWLNIGAAYLEKREWEKARESCEKFIKLLPEEGEASAPASQRAKAHYRMALACLELGIKDSTAFGPAIYFRRTARDAARAWALAEDSPALRQPAADLLRRLRDRLRGLQQAAAHREPGTGGVPVPPVGSVRRIEDPAPSGVDEVGAWGEAWVRALVCKLNRGEARVDSVRAADVVDLLERACLPHNAAALLAALTRGMEECPLYQQQLQLLLSLRAASWPREAYRTLSCGDWLLPSHCIGRFTAPLCLVEGEEPTAEHHLVVLLVQGLSTPPLHSTGDANVLMEWLMSQAPGTVSVYDNMCIDPAEPVAMLHIDLPRFEVVAGGASLLWPFDLLRMAAVAEPIAVAELVEPDRQRWS